MQHVYLTDIKLHNYRNLTDFAVEFQPNTNIIIGPNGSGKTSILEAISLLAPGRGFKASSFEEIVTCGNMHLHYQANLHSKLGKAAIDMSYSIHDKNRYLAYNGSKISSRELPNLLNIIWLVPQMARLFTDAASQRRKFLDRIIYNFYLNHLKILNKYEYYLQQRHMAFKYQSYSEDWLNTIDQHLANIGVIIDYHRRQITQMLQQASDRLAIQNYQAVINLTNIWSAENKDLNEQYELDFQQLYQDFAAHKSAAVELYYQALKNSRTYDQQAGRTMVGIHKADLEIYHQNNGLAAKLCSTGEQKTLLILLILASLEVLIDHTQAAPILLLDELFVHLDQANQRYLIDYIKTTKLQTLITATDMINLEELIDNAKIIDLT